MSLGDRMKRYEACTNYKIIPRAPIMIRADGKAFHTLTRKLKLDKPFDKTFSECISSAMLNTAASIQGCVLAYTQSDEITFAIRTDQSLETTPWFDNRIQKIVSVTASILTGYFNKFLAIRYKKLDEVPLANFDCRMWSMPSMVEVMNNFIWRQQDCVKNSISSAAIYEIAKKIGKKTTSKLLHKLNQNERQEALFKETGINWNNYDASLKRGTVAFRTLVPVNTGNGIVERNRWVLDAAPHFTGDEGNEWIRKALGILDEQSTNRFVQNSNSV